ncbi:RNA 2',3'-cyclic phosphodiesterase [Gorillibacterium sp. sgz500922]|uniref:RNA 2',3'-cyclic phosphodiesterase n=1 Tax=Gorillibacterium sp. sgz500922 TaxID=3446694 RepID=UPI003F67D25B
MNAPRTPESRCFAAVPLPSGCKTELDVRMRALHAELPFRTWPHPLDLHITLMFLGAVAEDRLPAVQEALAAAADRHAPFPLAVGRLGFFGSPASPRVLFAELEGDRTALSALAADVTSRLSAIGFPAENRPYSPHITLARRYQGGGDPGGLIRAAAEREWAEPLPFDADSVVLYRSHLGRSPMYEPLAIFPMKSEKSGKTTLFSER